MLLPVVLALSVIGVLALLMTYEGTLDGHRVSGETESLQARYVAEAGLAHAKWQLAQNTTCAGYTPVPATAFHSHAYSATLSPTTGSPVTMTATGTHASGIIRTLTATAPAFQPPMSLTLQPGPTQGKDVWFTSSKPGWNYGAHGDLNVSESAGQRSLLGFDLTVLPTDIWVISATLELFVESASRHGPVDIHRVTTPWLEGTCQGSGCVADGATWGSRNGQDPWVEPGSDYDPAPAFGETVDSSGPWQADITALVADWLAGKLPNYGMVIKGRNPAANVTFASSDGAESSRHPKLTMTYACECGVSCSAPSSGLVAHWKLDETTGNQAADSVGGHHGTVSGATWTAGKFGGALQFDGKKSRISVPHRDSLSLTSPFTLSAWIYVDTFGDGSKDPNKGYRTVLTKATSGDIANYWFGTWQSELLFGFWDVGVWREVWTSGLKLQKARWYHIAMTYDDRTGEVLLYVDGTQVLKASMPQPLTANKQDLQIGRSQYGEYWHGKLDDIRIYDRVLSAEEIAAFAAGG